VSVQVGIGEDSFPGAVVAHAKAAYAAGLSEPGPSPIRRFVWGFTLPIAVGRAMVRDRATLARYEEIVLTQVAAAFAVGATIALLGLNHWGHTRGGVGFWRGLLEIGSSLYAIAAAVEWAILALSRDFHAELTARGSYLTGVPAEPMPERPRVRLDVRWLVVKLRRRIREAVLVASGLPVAALVLFVPHLGPYLYAVLGALWTCYWVAVFAVANTPEAWVEPAPPPWFIRAGVIIGSVPFFGVPVRVYTALWRRVSASVFPACAAMERAPYEAAGLALARALASLPGVYLLTRPLFPVAAACALRARQEVARF
jgi:hypothetical protein